MIDAKRFPTLADVLTELPPEGISPATAAPRGVPKSPVADQAGKPSVDKKKSLKDFIQPDIEDSELTIKTSRAYGFDGFDVVLTVPVPAEFLKSKNKDPFGEIVYLAHEWMNKRTGLNLGRPSISTTDVARARARGGMKEVPLTWMVSDPLAAYALGADLTIFSFYGDVVSKEEIGSRFADAEKTAQEAITLRKDIMAGHRPETAWKEFLDKIAKKGMSYKIAKLHKLSASYPTIAKVLANMDEEFVDYLMEFYGPRGMYGKKFFGNGVSKDEIRKALDILKSSGHDFEGDSIDREYCRDIMFNLRGQTDTEHQDKVGPMMKVKRG